VFGDPGEVLAPRRLGVFELDGTTVEYCQAQTWPLVREPPLILGSASAPTGGWAGLGSRQLGTSVESANWSIAPTGGKDFREP
jgi:hypothetical protein